jgi:hypothetical protein
MNLIDLYVAEVGRRLPVKSRDDIEKELKSTLEDMLEDRVEKTGHPRDEAMEIELLKEYGAPDKVADTYHSTQYLIGPRMFPMFIFVLKIVGTVLSVMTIVGLGLALREVGFAGQEFARTLMQTAAEYIGITITAFGNIVVIFAILERTLPDSEIKGLNPNKEWDPATLPDEGQPDAVKRGELIAGVIFAFAGLVILNFYPQVFGMTGNSEGNWYFVPILFRFLPWLNVVWLAQIGLDLYLIRHNAWNNISRVAKILIKSVGLAITILFFRTPNVFGFSPEPFYKLPIEANGARALMGILNYLFPLIFLIIIIVQGIEIAKALYGFWKINYKTK